MKNNFIKTAFLIAVCVFSFRNINAQCDITDDLVSGFTSYNTPNGWVCNEHVSQYEYSGIHYTVLDGSDGTPAAGAGVLKSPVFPNGCNSLSFSWDWEMNDPGEASFKLELKKEDIIVWHDTITNLNAEPYTANTVSYNDLNIDGQVQLVITNLKTAQGYPVLNGIGLWNFCFTNYVVSLPGENYCDDFDALEEKWYDEATTTMGWSMYSAFNYLDETGIELTLENITAPSSYIASPVLNNGCSSIHFKYQDHYGYYFHDKDTLDLKIEIKQGDSTVWADTVRPLTMDTWTEYSIDTLNIQDSCQLFITNISYDYAGNHPAIQVKDICVMPVYNFTFNVPKDATVFVGEKDKNVTVAGNYLKKHYIPFTEKPAVYIAETDTSKIWYYKVSKIHNYRVRKSGGITQVGTFSPRTTDSTRVFTNAQLLEYSPQEIDHDVTHLLGRNVADILLNINAQGYLTLPLQADTTFQIVNCRNWQAIDTDVNNYFIDPDFHYTVVNENGEPDNSVITISDKGLITPVGAGTAIVLVTYDAMMCYHTRNVGGAPALFSALWPENTGVFVVSVDAPATNITSNMLINEYWSGINGTDKVDSTLIDAELDVLYYEEDKGSFPYTFKPEGVTAVEVATPTVDTNSLSYNGFSTDSVTTNTDDSYTVHLTFGRNIIKLTSATGSEYQVITAKPVDYTVSNITDPEEMFEPGDSVSVLFNTLYHPCNKLSGIYNMSAGIQYTGSDVNFPLILGPGQYTFASRAQEYIIVIPDTITSDEYNLTQGVLKVKGFGSYYGEHRNITQQSGVAPNLSASIRTGYFGVLPDIHIKLDNSDTGISTPKADQITVCPNPFTDHIVINALSENNATIYDLSGKTVMKTNLKVGRNIINTSTLDKGVYIIKCGTHSLKVVK